MKVLFVNKNLAIGGGERLIVDLAKEFKKHRHTFDIAIFEDRIEFDVEGLKIVKLSNIKSFAKFLRIFFAPYFFFKLLFIAGRYDYIFSFERYPAYFNVLISKALKKKSIIYLQNSPYYSFRQIYTRKITRSLHLKLHQFIFKLTNKIGCVSQGIKKEIIKDFNIDQNKVFVLPPSINPKEIDLLLKQPLAGKEKRLFDENKVIISIGRLHPQKNYQLLIKSFYYVCQKIRNAKLIIVGEGKERKKLEELITSFKLNDKVALIGSRKNPYQYLVKTNVFVLTSKFEGFPHVLLESLYCKVPVISLNCPYGPKEILAPDYGLLIDAKDKELEKTLAENIINVLENYRLRKDFIKNSRRRALNFTIDQTYKKLVGLLC